MLPDPDCHRLFTAALIAVKDAARVNR